MMAIEEGCESEGKRRLFTERVIRGRFGLGTSLSSSLSAGGQQVTGASGAIRAGLADAMSRRQVPGRRWRGGTWTIGGLGACAEGNNLPLQCSTGEDGDGLLRLARGEGLERRGSDKSLGLT